MITVPQTLRFALAAATVSLAACGSMNPMAKDNMAAGSTGSMSANAMNLGATLSSAAEVPPNNSPATGMMTARLDKATNRLTWRMTYSGLTGPVTAAHFHGPALPGANAGVVVPITPATSPSEGSATLTAAQMDELTSGRWYVNVHTAMYPGGEIRGQVTAK